DGAITDGVSLLVVRLRVGGPGQVSFRLEGDVKNGSLWDIRSFEYRDFIDPGKVSLDNITTCNVSGQFYAFALYKPPAEFGDYSEARKRRTVKIKADYDPKLDDVRAGTQNSRDAVSNKPEVRECSIVLARPPVVLVHGTYDNPKACWHTLAHNPDHIGEARQPLKDRLEALGFEVVTAVDYSATNGKAPAEGAEDHSRFERSEERRVG